MSSTAKLVTVVAAFGIALLVLPVLLFETQERQADRRASQIHLERGMRLFHAKAFLDAERELRWALRADPEEWKAPFYVGAVQIERKRYGLAIPYLERALFLNPTEPKILNALGVVYFKLGRIDMAKGYFWASLDIDPMNESAKGLMETMAKLQRRADQLAQAKEN